MAVIYFNIIAYNAELCKLFLGMFAKLMHFSLKFFYLHIILSCTCLFDQHQLRIAVVEPVAVFFERRIRASAADEFDGLIRRPSFKRSVKIINRLHINRYLFKRRAVIERTCIDMSDKTGIIIYRRKSGTIFKPTGGYLRDVHHGHRRKIFAVHECVGTLGRHCRKRAENGNFLQRRIREGVAAEVHRAFGNDEGFDAAFAERERLHSQEGIRQSEVFERRAAVEHVSGNVGESVGDGHAGKIGAICKDVTLKVAGRLI